MSGTTVVPAHRRRLWRWTDWSLALASTLVGVGLALYQPVSLRVWDNAVYDTVLTRAGPGASTGQVVIVDIDERSLAAEGQWPWRRDRLAQLLARIRALGAAAVGVDILLAEPDRHRDHTPRVGIPIDPDRALADTVRAGGIVLSAVATFASGVSMPPGCQLHPLEVVTVQRARTVPTRPFFRASGAICPIPVLTHAAERSGFINASADRDGIFRRVPLVMNLNGRPYPALALATVLAATQARSVAHHLERDGTSWLRIDDRLVVPLGDRETVGVRFRGRRDAVHRVSAAEVLTGRISHEVFQDKVVFVGTTALGTHDLVRTPVGAALAGVEVHATVADNLLAGDLIVQPGLGNLLEAAVVLLLAGITLFVCRVLGTLRGTTIVMICLAAVWYVAVDLLDTRGIFLSPLYPSLGAGLALVATTIANGRVWRAHATPTDLSHSSTRALMVQSLLSLTELRDAETGRHSHRTQRFTELLARALSAAPKFRADLTPERIRLLASLAPLHDIGKVGVPDHILRKRGPLTPAERDEMQRHPVYGRAVICRAERQLGLDDDEVLAVAKEVVFTHHERWDGAGYPARLRGNKIPVAGRVLAIVDVYDAAVTRALYRPRLTHDEAVQFIVDRAGTHFDPDVVAAFTRVAAEFERVLSESEPLSSGSTNHAAA